MLVLHQWDIVRVRIQPDDRDLHPAVVISSDNLAVEPKRTRVNVLYCSKKPPAKTVEPHQVLLNSADGLDFLTTVDCRIMYVVDKAAITDHWGQVSFERRRAISQKLIACFHLRF